jgi:hypothetical protein
MRITLFIIPILLCIYSFGQPKNENSKLSSMSGILFFERTQDVYNMYFVESFFSDLGSLLKNRDTINVFTVGSPGDDAKNIAGFKTHLDKTIRFNSMTLLVNQENYQGLGYEDSVTVYSKSGCIKYVKRKMYQLSRSYKKVYFNNKVIIFVLQRYIPIESFSKTSSCKKKSTKQKK